MGAQDTTDIGQGLGQGFLATWTLVGAARNDFLDVVLIYKRTRMTLVPRLSAGLSSTRGAFWTRWCGGWVGRRWLGRVLGVLADFGTQIAHFSAQLGDIGEQLPKGSLDCWWSGRPILSRYCDGWWLAHTMQYAGHSRRCQSPIWAVAPVAAP